MKTPGVWCYMKYDCGCNVSCVRQDMPGIISVYYTQYICILYTIPIITISVCIINSDLYRVNQKIYAANFSKNYPRRNRQFYFNCAFEVFFFFVDIFK